VTRPALEYWPHEHDHGETVRPPPPLVMVTEERAHELLRAARARRLKLAADEDGIIDPVCHEVAPHELEALCTYFLAVCGDEG
jgi:hypothetical protein